MKKALLLALAGFFAAVAPVLAYPPAPANVNFASERGVAFGLVLDGRPLTRGVARQVHVDRLAPGLHWADFTLPAAYGRVVRFRSRVWLEPGLETTFVLIARPGRPLGLQQVSTVALYGGYGNGYRDGGRYNAPTPYPPVVGNNGYPTAPNDGGYYPAPNGNNGSYDNGGGYNNNNPNNNGGNNYPNGNNGGNNYPNNGNGGYNNAPANGGYNGPTNGNGGNGSYNGNGNGAGNSGGSYPGSAASSYRTLAPSDMEALVRTMQQRITEVSKLNAAKDGLNQRSLQADELSRLLRNLNSEACRIDLAKFAYEHVTDPQNFSRVYDAFETESGAQAVEQAIREGSPR